MSFVGRVVNLSFNLASGSFAEGGDTVSVSGLRVSARIDKAGIALSTCTLQIWGLTLSVMNQLSTLGMQIILVPRNRVTVTAGDAGGTLTTVFQGTITAAWMDAQSAPDTVFHVEATAALDVAVKSVPPTSFKGSTPAATILSKLAGQAGFNFENSGVDTQLSNPYLHGSLGTQIQQAAEAAGITAVIDDDTLAIMPKGKGRSGDTPTVSPQSEPPMIGYPTYTSQGIAVSTVFNPAIKFRGLIQVQSSLQPACGTWVVLSISHALDAQMPKGEWRSTMQCYNPSFANSVIPQ